jgi:hypothetical protein
MACAITGGYAIECTESVGGVETIYLIENSNLYDASGNSRVTSASGVVTALTKDSGTRFWKFEVPRGTASATNSISASPENGTFYFTHEVKFPINSRSATIRNIVTTLAKNRLTFVCVEGDGTSRLYGKEFGLQMTGTEAGSGVALADRNGYMLTFTSMEREDFLVVPSNIVAALETPGT